MPGIVTKDKSFLGYKRQEFILYNHQKCYSQPGNRHHKRPTSQKTSDAKRNIIRAVSEHK